MGRIEVICGPMYAGKTEELLRRTKRLDIAKKKYILFKPTIDNRYSKDCVVSHNQRKQKCLNLDINNEDTVLEYINDYDIFVFDEVQFFSSKLIDVIKKLAKENKRIICAGLDCDFKGEPFGIMPYLLCISDEVLKLKAICPVCGDDASMTQRLYNNVDKSKVDDVILVGASKEYEPRCHIHHEIKK